MLGVASGLCHGAGTARAIDLAFESHDYVRAFDLSMNAAVDEKSLLRWAHKGSAPAMWMLADYYRRQGGREQASADWTYMALLTTRMDMSVCLAIDAQRTEKDVTGRFSPVVNVARSDHKRASEAIRLALRDGQRLRNEWADPGWICREGGDGRTVNQAAFAARRGAAYMAYARASQPDVADTTRAPQR